MNKSLKDILISKKTNKNKQKQAKTSKNKLSINKKYSVKKKTELIDSFYSLDNTISTILIKYNDPDTKKLLRHRFNNFQLCKGFELDILNSYFSRINSAYVVKDNLLKSMGIDWAPMIVRNVFEDFTRGLARFITSRYHKTLPTIKVSNAFMKMWEILSTFDLIPPLTHSQHKKTPKSTTLSTSTTTKPNTTSSTPSTPSTPFRVFHICEAPGQMILATRYYAIRKCHYNMDNYDWRAQSLNPFDKVLQGEYGDAKIFGDDYGLIKNNPKRWIWGADNTGDITRTENIKWYRNYNTRKWGQPHIIIGDGGLKTDLDPLLLQKLDLAQVIAVLACSGKGGVCVIKHFTPYIKRHKGTYEASGFFIGFLYLYYLAFESVSLFKPYSSNPDSGEFYVVGEGFRGIDERELDRLYEILDNFKLNSGIIKLEDIPETFISQINQFLEKMSNLNTIAIEKQNMLLTCYKDDKNPKLQKYLKCDTFMNPDNLQNIQVPRYNEWIRKYKFI